MNLSISGIQTLRNKLVYKHATMTMKPQMVKAKARFLRMVSKTETSSSSDPINLYPNNPGRMKEMAVEPVAPTIAKTNAKDLMVIARKYAEIKRPEVMIKKVL